MTIKTTTIGDLTITLHKTLDSWAVQVKDDTGILYWEEAESLEQAEQWYAAEVRECKHAQQA